MDFYTKLVKCRDKNIKLWLNMKYKNKMYVILSVMILRPYFFLLNIYIKNNQKLKN